MKTPKNRKRLILTACPNCVNDKVMEVDRKAKIYSCGSCGRAWKDERLEVGMTVVFVSPAHSQQTWDMSWVRTK